jgi:hypothetical protein
MNEELIFSKIFLVKGQKVILDSYLAIHYGVETKRFQEAIAELQDAKPFAFEAPFSI